MLESNGKDLMEAFKKELYQIVDYAATPAPEVTDEEIEKMAIADLSNFPFNASLEDYAMRAWKRGYKAHQRKQ